MYRCMHAADRRRQGMQREINSILHPCVLQLVDVCKHARIAQCSLSVTLTCRQQQTCCQLSSARYCCKWTILCLYQGVARARFVLWMFMAGVVCCIW
jgi:hypothetical protein